MKGSLKLPMIKRKYWDYSDEKRIKIRIFNILIILIFLFILCMIVKCVKEGMVATAASRKYAELNKKAIMDEDHMINFSIVHAKGSGSTSWIYIPGTNIDYPLVQGPDNSTYLNKDAYGSKNEAGAIFINFANSQNLTDAKTVIFGHNMINGTMFADLHNYTSKSYAKKHSDMYIYMDGGEVKHYKVLYHMFTTPYEESIYITSKTETPEQANAAIEKKADLKFKEFVGGKLVALSTCTMHDHRTIVVFEYVDSDKPSDTSRKYAKEAKRLEEIERKKEEERVQKAEEERLEKESKDSAKKLLNKKKTRN